MTNTIKSTETIWRYMSPMECLTLVTQQCLMFRKLIRMRDSDRAEGMSPNGYEDLGKSESNDMDQFLSNRWGACWMRNAEENALMWRAYAPRGVAIKATVGGLLGAINEAKDRPPLKSDVEALEMLYHDEWDEVLKSLDETGFEVPDHPHLKRIRNYLLLARIKRKAFAVENEIRFLAEPTVALASEWKERATTNERPIFPDWLTMPVDDLHWIEKLVVDESVEPNFAHSWLSILPEKITDRAFHRGKPLSRN